MLPQSSAHTLRTLTRLPKSVDGTVSFGPGGTATRLSTSASSSSVPSGPPVALDVAKLKKCTLLSEADFCTEGGAETGPVTLQGLFVEGTQRTFAGVALVSGKLPPFFQLVRFQQEDLTSPILWSSAADTSSSVRFVTQNGLMPLAPEPAVIEKLWQSTTPPTLLVVCANGLYVLHPMKKSPSSADALAVYKNLLEEVRFVADARTTSSTDGGFICRIAPDAVAVLDGVHDSSRAEEVQRLLRTGPYEHIREILPSSTPFTVSASLLEGYSSHLASSSSTDFSLLRQALESVFSTGVKVTVEPLVLWQTPPVAVDVSVVVTALSPLDPGSEEPVHFSEKILLHGGQLGVALRGSRPTVRPMRVGEEPGSTEKHFQRLLNKTVQEWFSKLPLGAPSQEALNVATQKAGADLRETLSAAGLFAVPVQVKISAKQLRTQGERVALPSGLECTMPRYSTADPPSARLSALLGAMPSLGVGASFVNWKKAEASGVPLGW